MVAIGLNVINFGLAGNAHTVRDTIPRPEDLGIDLAMASDQGLPQERSLQAVGREVETRHLRSRRVLLISGSTRSASTNTALCRTAPFCTGPGVKAESYEDIAGLPHFNPDDDQDPLPAAVVALRADIASADAVLFCTPEYAGTLRGSFKHLLDWMVGSTELTDKPVAWVKVAADQRRGEGTHSTLATVLSYVQARVIEAPCRHVPVTRQAVGTDGLIADPAVREAIAQTLNSLLEVVEVV